MINIYKEKAKKKNKLKANPKKKKEKAYKDRQRNGRDIERQSEKGNERPTEKRRET